MRKKEKPNKKIPVDKFRIIKISEEAYDPDYYTGGKILPFLRKPGKPKLYGIFMISISIIFLLLFIAIIVKSLSNKSTFEPGNLFFFSIFIILVAGVLILQIAASFIWIKESIKKKRYKK
jgi:hypothetical protein